MRSLPVAGGEASEKPQKAWILWCIHQSGNRNRDWKVELARGGRKGGKRKGRVVCFQVQGGEAFSILRRRLAFRHFNEIESLGIPDCCKELKARFKHIEYASFSTSFASANCFATGGSIVDAEIGTAELAVCDYELCVSKKSSDHDIDQSKADHEFYINV
ncbi:hypothetical protein ZIOFF_065010 [Zingiber officinale]|uniref:Uncharacterized protein n=1 Tax=Zingiber officinale TaxID=94328 RepID=A0A8J5EWL8_ZINOF|nr:hypothetical protein ZIOFF_065010 [Zingiber officinale]